MPMALWPSRFEIGPTLTSRIASACRHHPAFRASLSCLINAPDKPIKGTVLVAFSRLAFVLLLRRYIARNSMANKAVCAKTGASHLDYVAGSSLRRSHEEGACFGERASANSCDERSRRPTKVGALASPGYFARFSARRRATRTQTCESTTALGRMRRYASHPQLFRSAENLINAYPITA